LYRSSEMLLRGPRMMPVIKPLSGAGNILAIISMRCALKRYSHKPGKKPLAGVRVSIRG
jgi:hypothetical protein